MKKFLISVNGNQYEVEVEEVQSFSSVPATAQIPAAAPSAPVAARVPAAVAATAATAPAAAPEVKAAQPKPQTATPSAGSETVTAPMPGTILKVAVTAGQQIEKGQLLCVLEAMKMENEIVAARAGKIAGVMVTRGATVNAGDPLVSLE